MAEIADANLPVFPFRINWKQGLAERLEWKTDVLGDFLGNEQRRSLRLTPRREFEATLSLWDAERSFWDLWLHRMGDTEFLFPLWHDSVRAAQEAAQGQNTVWVDTRGLGFQIGSYGLLRGNTALSYERIQIAEVHEDRIVTVSPLNASWPKGTRVEPLIRGRMTDQTDVKAISSRVSESQAVFEATREQPFDEGVDSWDQFMGLPVLTSQPNRTQDVGSAYQWSYSESDSGTGRRYRKSDTGRAITQQKHSWLLRGRTAKNDFRSLCYRLRGAAGGFWLPTFNDDLQLAQNTAPATASLYVRAIGWAYTGGASSGREYVCIWLKGGTRLYRRITGTAAAPAGQERLIVDTPFPAGLLMSQVRMISFMDTARFQNDRIEFNHVNAADGATTVAGVFQTYRNERQAPAILSLPIPAASENAGPCGPAWDPENGDPCGPPPNCPPYPVVIGNGVTDSCADWAPTVNLYAPPWNEGEKPGTTQVGGNWQPSRLYNEIARNNGVTIPAFVNPIHANRQWYERDDYVNPEKEFYQVPGWEWADGRLLASLVGQGNQNWTWTFYFDVPSGPWHMQIQYGAGLCGAVGKEEGRAEIGACRTGGVNGKCSCPYGPIYQYTFAGLWPADHYWNF